MAIITIDDLTPFADIPTAKAEAMIADALAPLSRIAPCLVAPDADPALVAEARAIVRRAVLRWNAAGTGAVVTERAGIYSETVDSAANRPKHLYWPSEIAELTALCRDSSDGTGAAFMIDMTGLASDRLHPLEGAWVNGPDELAPTRRY